jgi:hypothetical protein
MNSVKMSEMISRAADNLQVWFEQADYAGYDTFDGLSSPIAPVATLNIPILKQFWQQGVRRFPVNLRPVLGIRPSKSTKAMAFFAQGYMYRHKTWADERALERMKFCLDWLDRNRCPEFKGHAWGNHFDYQSRGGNIGKGTPTIVWTALIGLAFLDAFEYTGEERWFKIAKNACEFIVNELGWIECQPGILLRYFPDAPNIIHNSSMLGSALLARVSAIEKNDRYLELASRAVTFTVHHQNPNGSWYYGVGKKWEWVDSFHTGYVIESLHTVCQVDKSPVFREALQKGYDFFFDTFFLEDGTPRYYDYKTYPIDIQCASQGIQTLVNLADLREGSVPLATKVALWTIKNMQDASGYFHYRKYPLIANKTPTLHWGQATMFAALALLNNRVSAVAQDSAVPRN